ncbi:hypothetical protein [Clostridium tarantellae]|uniref:HPr kinase/phosphorylase C-terminal domain-containing protein n=1 Tax=Clostridium tarantellae TaxID=39493 RepID=A0A6I1MMJ2_9CLOT|nr:hypothetical protein [Clostridium tarantellae]MPQ44224.1 hypothetical protein [Clostridium tarantellae]
MRYYEKKKKNFFYRIYGLNVKSNIKLPELIEIGGENIIEDVTVFYGIMPKEILKRVKEGKILEFLRDKAWFNIKKVAAYYISNGNNIIIMPYEEATEQEIKTYLLGSAFGALLIQRNIVVIHGGTIIIKDKAITLTGDSGAGKSTLTSAFRMSGFSFLADDVSAVVLNNFGIPFISPAYPQQKLCRDAMIKLGYDTNNFIRIDEGRDKFVIPVNGGFLQESKPLVAVCEIAVGNVDSVQIEEIKGNEKLKVLLKNIYRIEFIKISGMYPEYFKKCVNVAQNILLFKIIRPKDKFSVNEQMEIIEKIINERIGDVFC